jgi:hypothetical protein
MFMRACPYFLLQAYVQTGRLVRQGSQLLLRQRQLLRVRGPCPGHVLVPYWSYPAGRWALLRR